MNDKELETHETERRGEIRAVFSFVLVLAILIISVGVAAFLIIHKVKAKQVEIEKSVPSVEVVELRVGRHVPEISSEGAVRSRREVRLAAEVSGKVVWISDQLIEGGRVEAEEVIARIDKADFVAALARAEASQADAELSLAVEKAKGEQAEKDWAKLGRGEAPPLVLRTPQIASAQARLDSAIAEVERAKRDVERTSIKAPFSGRVREAGIEVGSVAIPGTVVAEIYSDEDLEVRLPFSLDDFGYVRQEGSPPLTLTAEIGAQSKEWPAELVRVEGEVERSTLSGHAIAKVMANQSGGYPPVGLFVKTSVKGAPIEGVVEIPRSALRGGNVVWLVRDGVLHRRTVDVLISNRENLVVTGEFAPGEQLVITRMNAPIAGNAVNAVLVKPDQGENSEN